MRRAVARAHPNIALVKYWGKRDVDLNLPAVPSLSLTLSTFYTRTAVRWGADEDRVMLNGAPADERTTARVLAHLDRLDPQRPRCAVDTANSFPTGAGLASSSSAFAALTLAAAAAAGKTMLRERLSVLARRGSGSACRSVWGGFVEWKLGDRPDGLDSHGVQIAPPSHWDLRLLVAVVSDKQKPTGSTDGMELSRRTSPYYDRWVETGPRDVEIARDAIERRDLQALGEVMEASTFKMHALMHTSRPMLNYWLPETLAVVRAVHELRAIGKPAWVTMDAGPNVKILTLPEEAEVVERAIKPYVDVVHTLRAGGDARVETTDHGA